MNELLSSFIGKRLDIYCGGMSSVRGKALKIDGGVLHLVDDDDHMFYVAVERIIVFSESRESEQRVGFISNTKAGFTSK